MMDPRHGDTWMRQCKQANAWRAFIMHAVTINVPVESSLIVFLVSELGIYVLTGSSRAQGHRIGLYAYMRIYFYRLLFFL